MEYLFLISLLITGTYAPAGQHGHHQHFITDCFGLVCNDHHNLYCGIKGHDSVYFGQCVSDHECHHDCGAHDHHHEGCCCYDQQCVDRFKYAPVTHAPLTISCYDCHDLNHCNQHIHQCGPDNVCMFKQHGHIEARCISKQECYQFKHDATTHHPDQYVTCCTTDNCTNAVMKQYQAGAGISLQCKTCHDVSKDDCQGVQTCHNDEVCMVYQIDHRIESGCRKAPECEANHNLHTLTVCCDTLDCAQKAVSAVKHVHVIPSTAVPTTSAAMTTATSTCNDNEDATFKCSDYVRDFDICNQVTITSKMIASTRCQRTCGLCPNMVTSACSDHEDGNFSCAAYIRDFNICQKVNGTGLSLAITRCQKSCGLCPGNGLTQTTDPVGTPTPAPTVSATTMRPSSTTQAPTNPQTQAPTNPQTQAPTHHQTTTQAPTTVVTKAIATNPPCVDHDVQNYCTAYQFYFCSATTGQARDFAVSNCARTCNLCNEYFASLTNNHIG